VLDKTGYPRTPKSANGGHDAPTERHIASPIIKSVLKGAAKGAG